MIPVVSTETLLAAASIGKRLLQAVLLRTPCASLCLDLQQHNASACLRQVHTLGLHLNLSPILADLRGADCNAKVDINTFLPHLAQLLEAGQLPALRTFLLCTNGTAHSLESAVPALVQLLLAGCCVHLLPTQNPAADLTSLLKQLR